MDLGLEIDALFSPGRRPAVFEAEVVRELTEADLQSLTENRGIKPIPLVRVSERHHALARAIAGGATPYEASIMCGYQLSRVSILCDDPAFKELIEFYRGNLIDAFRATAEKLGTLTADAIGVLQDRLEETPEKFSNKELRELTQMGLDRTGHGPSHKVEQNINVNLSSRIEMARKRALEDVLARARDITPDE